MYKQNLRYNDRVFTYKTIDSNRKLQDLKKTASKLQFVCV